MDSYERWAVESLALHKSQEVPHLVKTGAQVRTFAHSRYSLQVKAELFEETQSAITLLYIPCLMLEFSVREHLRRRVSAAENENVGGFPSESIASLISFLDATEERCQRSLCTFLRHTRVSLFFQLERPFTDLELKQNREGVYLLSAVTGFLCSVDRLASLATTLSRSSKDEYALFPIGAVDKLASVTLYVIILSQGRDWGAHHWLSSWQ